MKNFMGLDSNFIWWQGVVESNSDPLILGRCKVRILGFHPANEEDLIPTKHLPWAHPIYPINGHGIYSTPKVGEWVMGFFRDGRDAQEPVMWGVLPGKVKSENELGIDESHFGGDNRLEKRHFEFVANTVEANIDSSEISYIERDLVFMEENNVWWRVNGNIDSYSNEYIHSSNNSITLSTGDTSNTEIITNQFVMQSNSGIDITSNGNISITVANTASITSNGDITIEAANNAMSLNAGMDVTATSSANSYPIVASFDELYERVRQLEEDLAALAIVVSTKADAGHSHE
jgi:hypothetical protein